jgi:hypothetical protein
MGNRLEFWVLTGGKYIYILPHERQRGARGTGRNPDRNVEIAKMHIRGLEKTVSEARGLIDEMYSEGGA